MTQSLAIPRVIPNDWKRLDLIVNKIKMRLGSAGSPVHIGLTLTGLTASSLIGTNASKALESVTIGNSLDYTRPTLNTIQDIRTTASPTFAGLTIGSAIAHDPTLTFASEGTDGTISWEDIGDYFKISTDVDINGFIDTEFLFLSGAVPGIQFEVDDILHYAADTWTFAIGGTTEYTLSATVFDAQSNNITTSGNLLLTGFAELRLYDDGANYIGFEAPALDADQIWVLPNADGNAGEVMVTDASGNLTWSAGVPGPPAAHTHDGDTLQLDGINSNSGAFNFTTSGIVTFSESITMSAGKDLTIAGHIIFNTDNSYIGFATARLTLNGTTGTGTFTGALIGTSTAIFEGASVTVGKASTTTGTIVLHDSGSANTITLTVPDSLAGSLSFTLPPTDGDNTNVLQTNGNGVLTWVAAGGGSAFTSRISVYRNAVQSIPSGNHTKIEFNAENYDNDNEHTGGTFTAIAAGYYHVVAQVWLQSIGASKSTSITIRKNNTEVARSMVENQDNNYLPGPVSKDVYLNGSTDYIEIFCYHNSGVNRDTTGENAHTYCTIHRFA